MKDATISELYDLTQTIAAKIFEGKTYPWEVLPLIKDFILELGETLDPAAVSYTHLTLPTILLV